MADRQIGRGVLYALATITIDKGDVGYCLLKTWRIAHNASVDRIKLQTGQTGIIIGNDEALEISVDYIPSGATRALAAANARLPVVPSGCTIAGAPELFIGNFGANCLNSALWIYEGGGTINGVDDSHWTASFVLRRYEAITNTTAIV